MKVNRWWQAGAAVVGAVAVLMLAGSLIDRLVYAKPLESGKKAEQKATETALKRAIRSLEAGLQAVQPKGLYIVIDTAENRLTLKRGERAIKEFVVSCGSGGLLEDPQGARKWIFDTPRGEYAVQTKLVNPTWIKPDWAFIEEGESIPSDYNERIDNDTLGDFALGFGNGYFIHGTLYTRLLGRNVTHGCVRVGDKDLKEIYQAAGIGTRVYIY
jgi:lipoprotein-anchoring transpeptidase ErfK/SrfK